MARLHTFILFQVDGIVPSVADASEKRAKLEQLLAENSTLREEISRFQKLLCGRYGVNSAEVCATDPPSPAICHDEKPTKGNVQKSKGAARPGGATSGDGRDAASTKTDAGTKAATDAKKKKAQPEGPISAELDDIHPGRLDFRVGTFAGPRPQTGSP